MIRRKAPMINSFCEWMSGTEAPEGTADGRPKDKLMDRHGVMKPLRFVALSLLVGALVLSTDLGFGETAQATSDAGSQAVGAVRDGQHDFDFNIGVWHTHIRRVLDPLSGSDKSIVLDGTVTVRKVFDGRAQLEEIEADGPNGHWEGLTLFLYNPQAHQWSQTFIDSKMAALNSPEIGAFHDGRGELFSSDTFDGKAILVRAVWSNIEPDSHRFEES